MAWFPLLPRRRAALLRVWPLLAAVALAVCHVPLPEAQPSAYPSVPAAEEATPDTLAPPSKYAPALARKQHLARLGVERWHAAGFRGQGVKIAVLDSGFRGYRQFLGTALPAHVTVRSFRQDGNLEARESQHGILCGEVLHALAPEAELLFANWEPDRPESFLAAARWARAEGARVISCSLIMPSWSDGEGGGPVNEALAEVVGSGHEPGNLLCFASAGNTAHRHWSGPFQPDSAGFHQWRSGTAGNVITPWETDRVSVELYGHGASRYEVQVRDLTTGKPAGRSTVRAQRGRGDASCVVVRFLPQHRHQYEVRVRARRGSADAPSEPFHLVVLGGGLSCTTSKGSIPCPADGRAVQAVGAVDGAGKRQHYSSCGPNSPLPKPDFVAEVPFPSLWRDRPFAGTSAAAPQAAGLAALWWSRYPGWSAKDVAAAMRAAAVDLGPPGHDAETGYGRLALP
jgi:subtilisin family serine protease